MSNKFDSLLTKYEIHLNEVERDLHFEQSVGLRIREIRQKLGWSQQLLADYANIERNQVRRLEKGLHSPSLAIITVIAKSLGYQPFELIKTNFQVKVSKNLDNPVHRRRVITTYIRELSNTNFFKQARSVEDVIEQCKKKYDVLVPSSATSGVLKKLVDEKRLKRTKAKIKGRFVYQQVA